MVQCDEYWSRLNTKPYLFPFKVQKPRCHRSKNEKGAMENITTGKMEYTYFQLVSKNINLIWI